MRFAEAMPALRTAVIYRFAEKGEDGPLRCEHCPDRKVVFESERAIRGAVDMLFELDGEGRRPYQCTGSTSWHYTRRAR